MSKMLRIFFNSVTVAAVVSFWCLEVKAFEPLEDDITNFEFHMVNLTHLLQSSSSDFSDHSNETEPATRILNGRPPRRGILKDFFNVAMMDMAKRPPELICGASLIGNKWVLTAAHCAVSINANTEFWAGVHDISQRPSENSGGQTARAVRYYHPGYKKTLFGVQHDLAVVELNRDIPYSDIIRPIRVSRGTRNYQRAPVFVDGWGKTACGGGYSNELRQTQGSLRTFGQCRNGNIGFTDRHLCATFNPSSSAPFNGDSGGALFVDVDTFVVIYEEFENGIFPGFDFGIDYGFEFNEDFPFVQIGIVSYGFNRLLSSCLNTNRPLTFTNVAKYADFIQKVVPDLP